MKRPPRELGKPDRLLLVGMMGAGKTTVARQLADLLGWHYVDSDTRIESESGVPVPVLLAQQGEPAFRSVESAVLRTVLAEPEPQVVAVAGGAVIDRANRRLLRRSGTVVWLRADARTLIQRVGDGRTRPLLGDVPAISIRQVEEVRRPLYEEVADIVVDVDDIDPQAVAERVLAGFRDVRRGTDTGSSAR